ncbi:MAG: monovalent cation/H(+) antiporter subunit G [Clostridiales bacterium]|nr:monovalent cation/H(+) antiporter subunit G [Clostridiales bacterium]
MSINVVQFVIAAIFIVAGIIITAIQTFAVFRFDYVLNRMHGAAMGDSLGILLIIAGLLVIYGISFASLKLIAIIVVFWFASPVCSHLLSKLEVNTNEHLEEECEVPEE